MKVKKEPYIYMNDEKQYQLHYFIKPLVVKWAKIFDFLLEEIEPKDKTAKHIKELFLIAEKQLANTKVKLDSDRYASLEMIVRSIRKLLTQLCEYDSTYRELVNNYLRFKDYLPLGVEIEQKKKA